jgi:unsaturated chondroitin disaccharide hydrolase
MLKALEKECCDFSEDTDLILSKGAEAYRYRAQKYIVYGDYYYLEALGRLCGRGIFSTGSDGSGR